MQYYGLSKKGKKSVENEDTYVLPAGKEITGKEIFNLEPNFDKQGYLFVICDGMGGHQAGEIASRLAVSWMWKDFYTADEIDDMQVWIQEEIASINNRLFNLSVEHDVYNGMGTTIVGVIIKDNQVYTFNVGDSRAYLLYDNQLAQITKDDSEVWEMLEKGLLTKDELVKNKKSHLITQALALAPSLKVRTYSPFKLEIASKILLCSDGVNDVLTDSQINDILVEDSDLQEIANSLVDSSLKEGSKDDITVVIIEA